MAKKKRFSTYSPYIIDQHVTQPEMTSIDILRNILKTGDYVITDPETNNSFSDVADSEITNNSTLTDLMRQQATDAALKAVDLQFDIWKRMPTVQSYVTRQYLNYEPESSSLIFDRRSKASYERVIMPQDHNYKVLFKRFIDPFTNAQNSGQDLIQNTIKTAQTVIDLRPRPGRKSIHDASYYLDLYKKSFRNAQQYDQTNIFSFDIETFGSQNIWQIGYQTNHSEKSVNRLLLPDQNQLAQLRSVLNRDFDNMTQEQKVMFQTLANWGDENTKIVRKEGAGGFATYTMESYAATQATKEKAIAGYEKIFNLTLASKKDKKLTVGDYTLTSSQKSFLDEISNIMHGDIIMGHNIERFDTSNVISQITKINGGWEYLKTLGVTRDTFTTATYFDTLDAIRSLSPEAYQIFHRGITANSVSPETRVANHPFSPNSMESFELLFGLKKEGDVSHTAGYDAAQTLKLADNEFFASQLTSALELTVENQKPGGNEKTFTVKPGDLLYAEQSSFGLMPDDTMIMFQTTTDDKAISFANGLQITKNEDNSLGVKAFNSGATVQKGEFQKVANIETIQYSSLTPEQQKIIEKTTPKLVDSDIIHVTLSNNVLDKEAHTGSYTTTHLFGTRETIQNTMSRMFQTDLTKIDDLFLRIGYGNAPGVINAEIEKRKKVDRARRSYNSASAFTQENIHTISDIIGQYQEALKDENIEVSTSKLTPLMMDNAIRVSQGVAAGEEFTLELQKELGVNAEQAALIGKTLKDPTNRILKAIAPSWKANPGQIRNIFTLIDLGDNFMKYHESYTEPIMKQVMEELKKHRNAKPEDITRKYKDIMQNVQKSFADEYIRRYGGDPDLESSNPNLFRLKTAKQFRQAAAKSGSLGGDITVNLAKRDAEYSLINTVATYYGYDPEILKESPSRQADLLVRFIKESDDPALEGLRLGMGKKRFNQDTLHPLISSLDKAWSTYANSDKGLSDMDEFRKNVLAGFRSASIPEKATPYERRQFKILQNLDERIWKWTATGEGKRSYGELTGWFTESVQRIRSQARAQSAFRSDVPDPIQMAQAILQEMRTYRDIHPDAGKVVNEAISLDTIARTPDKVASVVKDIKDNVAQRAVSQAKNAVFSKDEMLQVMQNVFIQDESSVAKTVNGLYGRNTRQAKHMMALYQSAAVEMSEQLENIVNAAKETSLEYNPLTGEFTMRTNKSSVDLTKMIPKLGMHSGALTLQLGNQHFLVDMMYGTDYDKSRVHVSTTVGNMFDIYPLANRIRGNTGEDAEYQGIKSYLYGADKRLRNGSTTMMEGTIQEIKYNFSTDFRNSYSILPGLTKNEDFLSTLSEEDRDIFIREFEQKYEQLDDAGKRRFMKKLEEGELSDSQSSIINRILPELNTEFSKQASVARRSQSRKLQEAHEKLMSVSENLSYDYKNSMMQTGIYETENLNIAGQNFTRTGRDIHNQVTRALYFTMNTAKETLEHLGIHDVQVGNAIMTQVGSSMLNARNVNGTVYSTNMQVPSFVGTKNVLSEKLDTWIDTMIKNSPDESDSSDINLFKKVVQNIKETAALGEGGALVDARITDSMQIQNDFQSVKLDETIKLFSDKEKTEAQLRKTDELNKLVPIIEKDENGNLHMRYTPGRYVDRNETFALKSGYAGSETPIVAKKKGIVKYGVFNEIGALVSDDVVSKDVAQRAKELGVVISSSEDFYNILHNQLNNKYTSRLYIQAVENEGVLKMTSDYSEKAMTRQLIGRIGQFMGDEVLDPLKKMGLGSIATNLRVEVFNDLINQKYNPYLAHEIKKNTGTIIESDEDFKNWISKTVGDKGFEKLSSDLSYERYIQGQILKDATGAYHVGIQDFIHHNTVWQPVNQLINDMVNYQVTEHGASLAEANKIVYRALQFGDQKTFLSVNGHEGLRLTKDNKLILANDYNLNLKGLSEAAQTAFGDILGRRKFVETMSGSAGQLNAPDEERIDQRAREMQTATPGLGYAEARIQAANEMFTSQDVLTIHRGDNDTPMMMQSSTSGYLTNITLAPQHDITTARSASGEIGDFNETTTRGYSMSDRELSKMVLARRDAQTIESARDLFVNKLNNPDEFLRIYGHALEDPTDVNSKIRKDMVNTSIEQPYAQEIRAAQFYSPGQIMRGETPVSETYRPFTEREQNILGWLKQQGHSTDQISEQALKKLDTGFDAFVASRANLGGLTEQTTKDLQQNYGFVKKDVANLNYASSALMAEHGGENLFNTSMILNTVNKDIGMTAERIQELGGVTSVATARVTPGSFGSQAVNDEVRIAGNALLRTQSELYHHIKEHGAEIEDEKSDTYRYRQHLEQSYADATMDLFNAQNAVATGKNSPLHDLTKIELTHYIRPKASVAGMDLYTGSFAQQAQYQGMSLAEYTQKTGLAPDVVVISSEQAEKMGILKQGENYQEQLDYLKQYGIQGHVNRSPSIYAGSVAPAHIYVNDEWAPSGQMTVSVALARKMKMDVDGDTAAVVANQFIHKNQVLTDVDILNLQKNKDSLKMYGFTEEDRKNVMEKYLTLSTAHQEAEIFQQTEMNKRYLTEWDAVEQIEASFKLPNPMIVKTGQSTLEAHNTFIQSHSVRPEEITDADVEAVQKAFISKVPNLQLASGEGIVLSNRAKRLFGSKESAEIRDQYEQLKGEYNLAMGSSDASVEVANPAMSLQEWAGTGKRKTAYNNYQRLLEQERQAISKTRQASAGIIDLPMYRMSRMIQLAGTELDPREAQQLQNLATSIQEGFLSPKNSSSIDWNAVSDLTDITGRMGRRKNGGIDYKAFEDMANWIRKNAAKVPGIELTTQGKLDTEHLANLVQTKLPEVFNQMPGMFKSLATFDQAFLAKRGIQSYDQLNSVLKTAMIDAVADNSLSGRILNLYAGILSPSDKKAVGTPAQDAIIAHKRNRSLNLTPKINPAARKATEKASDASGSLLESAAHSAQRIGGKKLIAGIIAGLGLAGYAGGNPSEDPNAEQKIQRQTPPPMQSQAIPRFSDSSMMGQRGMSSSPGGYIVNINAQTRQGREMAQAAINQATSNTFNQGDVNITMQMRQDQQTTPEDVTQYIQAALS